MAITRMVSDGTKWVEASTLVSDGTAWDVIAEPYIPPIEILSTPEVGSSFGTSINLPLGSFGADDLAYVWSVSNGTPDNPSGWTLIETRDNGSSIYRLWRKVLTGAEPSTLTLTRASGTNWAVGGVVLRGANTSTPEDTSIAANGAGSSATTWAPGTVTPTRVDTLYLFFTGMTGSTAAPTFQAGLTEAGRSGDFASQAIAYSYRQDTAPLNFSVTYASAVAARVVAFAVRPA